MLGTPTSERRVGQGKPRTAAGESSRRMIKVTPNPNCIRLGGLCIYATVDAFEPFCGHTDVAMHAVRAVGIGLRHLHGVYMP